MVFRVISIIDGNSFQINKGWKWNGKLYRLIKIKGYNLSKNDPISKARLNNLLLHKEVELGYPESLEYGRLICSVYIDEVELNESLLNSKSKNIHL